VCDHLSSCARFENDATNQVSGKVTCEVAGPVSPYFIGYQSYDIIDIMNPDATYDCNIPDYPLTVNYTGVAVILNDPDRIMICGGDKNFDYAYKECYELQAGQWELSSLELPPDAALRDGLNQLFVLPDRYWLVSTYAYTNRQQFFGSDEWVDGPDVTLTPVACLAQMDDTRFLNPGGGGYYYKAFIVDIEAEERIQTGPMKGSHIYTNCAFTKGCGWALGGDTPSFEQYDPLKREWTQLADMPHTDTAYFSHFFTAENNDAPVYIPLAEDRVNYYVYHVADDTWSEHVLPKETNTEFLGVSLPVGTSLLENCVLRL